MKLYILAIIIILLSINNHIIEARSVKNMMEIKYKLTNVITMPKGEQHACITRR